MRSAIIPGVTVLFVTAVTSGCGAGTATPTATSLSNQGYSATAAIVSADTVYLHAQLFTVDSHIVSRLQDGALLYIFHSICAGSADGHCQAVAVFRGSARKPIWLHQYVGVRGMRPTPLGFAITAVSYASQDPLCCPSLPDVTDTYTWDGVRFVERGPLPHQPGQ
jgi:hypothetical protein